MNKLREAYKKLGKKMPNEEAILFGTFSATLEARKKYFLEAGYKDAEAAAIARLSVSYPVSEAILLKSADWLSTWLYPAQEMLDARYEETIARVEQYARDNQKVFNEAEQGPRGEFDVQAVYPAIGEAAPMVIVHEKGTTEYYAADWEESEDHDIAFRNVRDISWNYENLISRIQQNLGAALTLVSENIGTAIRAESDYLASRVLGRAVTLPEIHLDGMRPAQEAELKKFYANDQLFEDRSWRATIMGQTMFEGTVSPKEAVSQLADSMNRSRKLNKRVFRNQVRLVRPTLGNAMKIGKRTEKLDVMSLSFSKKLFDSTSAKGWAKLHDFKYGEVTEGEEVVLAQSDCPCKKGSMRSLPIARGVSAAVCGRG